MLRAFKATQLGSNLSAHSRMLTNSHPDALQWVNGGIQVDARPESQHADAVTLDCKVGAGRGESPSRRADGPPTPSTATVAGPAAGFTMVRSGAIATPDAPGPIRWPRGWRRHLRKCGGRPCWT